MADQKVTARVSCVEKTLYQRIFGWLIKINHYIPAKYYIELQFEANRIHQIKGPEDYVGLNLWRHGKGTRLAGRSEVFGLPVGRELF